MNCYPKAQRNGPSRDPLSINLKFYDQDNDRPVIPTVRLRTQGLTIKGKISEEEIQNKIIQCEEVLTLEEHYWRIVYRYIWRKAFLDTNTTPGEGIDFSFDCIKTLNALKFMDCRVRVTQTRGIETLNETEVYSVYQERIALEWFDLFDSDAVGNIVCMGLGEADPNSRRNNFSAEIAASLLSH